MSMAIIMKNGVIAFHCQQSSIMIIFSAGLKPMYALSTGQP